MNSTIVCGMCVVGLWAGYIVYNNATHINNKPTRKTKQELTATRIDKQFDRLHKVGNTMEKHNTDMPQMSRYNYDRRRRPLFKNWF